MADVLVLEQMLTNIHNWFEREVLYVTGCEVSGGSLPASVTGSMLNGMWYRVQGSYLNDGLHLYLTEYPEGESSGLVDETFDGTISLLSVPKALVDLSDEISEWIGLNSQARKMVAANPYQSESFGGYTYSVRFKSSDITSSGNAKLNGWQSQWQIEFSKDLDPYRKLP